MPPCYFSCSITLNLRTNFLWLVGCNMESSYAWFTFYLSITFLLHITKPQYFCLHKSTLLLLAQKFYTFVDPRRSSNHVTIINASGVLYKLRPFLSHIHAYCFRLCLGLISVLYLCYTQCKWRSSNKPSSRHCYTISTSYFISIPCHTK